jgi:adenosylcobinamide kinase/adenosylcobinamide-phosphate guanylyltransferase
VLTLVTGGARSGKSVFAERLAAQGRAPVLYLATATIGDDEMRARVERHRHRRPAAWRTLEAPVGVGPAVARLGPGIGTVLLEDLGLLVSNLLFRVTGGDEPSARTDEELDAAVAGELADLHHARAAGGWDLIVVTNEVGLGIVPATPVGRVFRDALGRANQLLAAPADAVYLLVAGQPLRVKPPCPTCADDGQT